MASIQPRETGSGRRWDVVFRDPEGRQRRRTFVKHADARRFANTVEADRIRGTFVDTRAPITVGEYSRQWVEARPQRSSTRDLRLGTIARHIDGTPLGSRRLVDVRASEAQAWATSRAQILAPSTARMVLSLVRSIFAGAVTDRLIATSPAARVRLPSPPKQRVVPLTIGQVRTLADAMPERCHVMVIAQAGLGLRVSELFALRVSDVDFLRRTVRVEHQLDRSGRHRVPLKTHSSRRDVPLPQTVADALAAHLQRHPPSSPDGLIFTSRGHGYPYPTFRHIFAAAVERAGLPVGTTTHDLRHHYASILLAAGESVVAVAERLGHDNGALVLSTYGHLLPDSEQRTRAAIDAAWTTTTTEEEAAR